MFTRSGLVLLSIAICWPAFRASADFDGWRLMPVRSQGEFDRGEMGGRAEQYMQGAARCRANPNIIYLSHDCSQTWRSIDGGLTWEKPLNLGLYLSSGQSIEVDPVNCNRVVVVMDNAWDYRHTAYPGIYISEDGGDHWSFVQAGPTTNNRRYEHNVAWAPSSVDATGAKRWYVVLYSEAAQIDDDDAYTNADSALYISDDYGLTWKRGASLSGHNPVYEIRVSPSDSQIVYLATSQGLYRSTDGGLSITRVAEIPAGPATSVAIDPNDASKVYAVLSGGAADGLYRATAAGGDFSKLSVTDARRIFMHPTNGNVFYVVPKSAGSAQRTDDGGASFQSTSFSLPDDVSAWRWGIYFRGDWAFLLISATDSANVVGQSTGAAMYRSSDGSVFVNGATLFDGANCGTNNFNIAFDETDPERFAIGNQDIGMYYTETGANWFMDRGTPWSWYDGGLVAWTNQSSLSFQPGRTGKVVSSVGDMFDKKLAYSEDNGLNWTLVDQNSNYLWRVAYNSTSPNVVYAGDRRSLDGGKTFTRFAFPSTLDQTDLQVMDLCRAQPDTLYAASRSAGSVLRSDNQGADWRLYTTTPGSIAPFDPIPTFAVDPVSCDVIYALDGDGDLARFDGQNWTNLGVLAQVNAPNGYYTYVRSVMVDPRHPEVIYASTFGSGIPSFFRSVDSGATWQDISYNHYRSGSSGINISPVTGEVMVGGCSGTWVLPPPYQTISGIYERLVSRPSCYDGIQNGDEGGVDTGGRCSGGGGSGGGGGSNPSNSSSGGCGSLPSPGESGWSMILLGLLGLHFWRRSRVA